MRRIIGMTFLGFVAGSMVLAAVQTTSPLPPAPQNGDGTIEGIVKRIDNGTPIRDVRITLIASTVDNPQTISQLTTISDAAGGFVFRKLPHGHYRVDAERENYYGPAAGDKIPIVSVRATLDAITPKASVSIALMPSGTITGSLRDPRDQPAVNVEVRAMRFIYKYGRPTLLPAKVTHTSDRGEFRLSGLPAAEYYVRAGGPSSNAFPIDPAFASMFGKSNAIGALTYYPGTTDPELAAMVKVQGDDEVTANFRLLLPATVTKVSGTVVNATTGQPSDAVGFLLIPRDRTRTDDNMSGTMIPNEAQDKADGRFQITTSQIGLYDLMPVVPIRTVNNSAAAASGNPTTYTGRTTVALGTRDLDGLTITVTSPATIDLHVQTESVPPISLRDRTINLTPLEGLFSASPIRRNVVLTQSLGMDGKLKFLNVPDGEYAISVGIIDGVYVSDIRQGQNSVYNSGTISVHRDSADPVVIVLRSGGAKVEGVVVGPDGRPATSGKVTLIPQGERRANALLYRFTSLRDGRFSFVDIAPGVYKLFGWETIPFGAEQNVGFVSRYESQGRAVSLTSGSGVTNITLPLIRIR